MSGMNQCQNWKRLTGEGGDVKEEFYAGESNGDINGVEVDVLSKDPFSPPVEDTDEYSKFFTSSLLEDKEHRKCAAVDMLDSSLAPYTVEIPRCNHFSCDAENTSYEHKKDGCGNI